MKTLFQFPLPIYLAAGFEWTPVWGKFPTPSYQFSGTSQLSESTRRALAEKMDQGFRSSVTNRYKVFHIGLSYVLKNQ